MDPHLDLDAIVMPTGPVPAELGTGFAEVVMEALSWDDTRRAGVVDAFDVAWARDGRLGAAAARLVDGLDAVDAASGSRGGLSAASAWTDPLGWMGLDGAAYVALAVLARDHHLVTARDFVALTWWWRLAGLSLPAPCPAGGCAVDDHAVQDRIRVMRQTSDQASRPTNR